MYSFHIYHHPDTNALTELFEIQRRIFESPYSKIQILDRVADKQHFLSFHAYSNDQIVGFNSGYEMDSNSFYSWLGGVDPTHRKRGIAQTLMQKQHEEIKKLGFSRVETKTQNKFRDMII